jgi:hypothetical protein
MSKHTWCLDPASNNTTTLLRVPCSNGVLVQGRVVTTSIFPGVQLRVLDMQHTGNGATMTAVVVSDPSARVSMRLPFGVNLVEPDAPEPPFSRDERPTSGPALTYWAYATLKHFLLNGIRQSNALSGTAITVIIGQDCPEISEAFGITGEHGRSVYRLDCETTDKSTVAWDCVLGDAWDMLLHDKLVVYRMTFSICGPVYFRYLQASVRTAHGDFDRSDDYREFVREHCIKTAADRHRCNILDEDEESQTL